MRFLCQFMLSFCALFVSGCQMNPNKTPEIVPAVEVKKPVENSLNIIGAVEPVYLLPMKAPILARVDTGAETCSIDADNIKAFERDGEKWVSFDVINRKNGEKYHFEKKIIKTTEIKRLHQHEKRYVVAMDIKLGQEVITNVRFNLAKRDKFEYQALIGRNILTGRAMVDTSRSNTLN